MRQGILTVVMIFLIPLSAIGAPKIDATSDETMKKTIDMVRASLPENKREPFNEALKTVMFSQIDMGDLIASGSSGVNLVEGKMKQALHGKTGDEVIALAAQIKKKNQQQMRSQELTELQALEKKRIKVETAKKELAKFETLEARYYKKKYEVMGEIIQPIIEMKVKNGTQHAISRAYFIGTLKSPNRSIPWLREDFNYAIDGGIEPGETVTWHLSPNMYSKWGTVQVPEDATISIETIKLDGPNNEELFSSQEFTDRDDKRLLELKKKYKK